MFIAVKTDIMKSEYKRIQSKSKVDFRMAFLGDEPKLFSLFVKFYAFFKRVCLIYFDNFEELKW
jgi:hypothetical protein